MDILTAPQFAHRLLTFLTDEVLVPWVRTQREATGQPKVSGTEPMPPPLLHRERGDPGGVRHALRGADKREGRQRDQHGVLGYSYLYKHPEKFYKMLGLMASVSPGALDVPGPDVAKTGPSLTRSTPGRRRCPHAGARHPSSSEWPSSRIVEHAAGMVLAGARAERLVLFFNDVSVLTLRKTSIPRSPRSGISEDCPWKTVRWSRSGLRRRNRSHLSWGDTGLCEFNL